MNYNKMIRYFDKYNIKGYTGFGVPLTYNKLHHIVNDHTNTKTQITTKNTTVLNSILKMILMIMN